MKVTRIQWEVCYRAFDGNTRFGTRSFDSFDKASRYVEGLLGESLQWQLLNIIGISIVEPQEFVNSKLTGPSESHD